MKKILILIFSIILLNAISPSVIKKTNEETFTIYLIRHSEKDVFSENQTDPPLTECGKKRSESLSFFFENIEIENVYSTDYSRTLETANAISYPRGIEIKYYEPSELKRFSEKLLSLKKNSLVVGHSNTTPVLSGILIDESLKPFSEDIYNRIYKVEINDDKKKLIIINTDFQCK
ncbi:histidine phosphatase family protein [bacterium]|nr:histidine phosphatase family protein [bacterium]